MSERGRSPADRGARLVLVATPIGNLGDLSPRAVAAMAEADVLCCEDTRRTGRLLAHAGVAHGPMLVVNDHTETSASAAVIGHLDAGRVVALVTDAGMPAVADPGARIVAAAIAAGHRIEVVPGPSAVLAALVVSGLPTDRFVVEGFLPRKGAARAERIGVVAAERRTVVLLEAPHRIARTLAELAVTCGVDRPVVIARELTKLHEEVWRGALGDAAAAFDHGARGEIVIVLAGAPDAPPPSDDDIAVALAHALGAGRTRRDAAAEVADALGVPRRRVYALLPER